MNVVQHEPYLSNECRNYVKYSINNYKVLILTHIYSYFKINIQFRCSYPCVDSQVGQHKSRTKIAFFFKKNVVGHMIFAGRPTKMAGHTMRASFILDLPYLAHITSLCLSLII